MATKRTPSSMQREEEVARHPWIQLLDLEHRQQKPVLPKNPEGKPPRRFPRDKKMLIAMTSTESEALDTLVALFKKHIRANVVRADVIAFMAFRLTNEIQFLNPSADNQLSLPDEITSFTELANYLERGGPRPSAPEKEKQPAAEAKRRKTKES